MLANGIFRRARLSPVSTSNFGLRPSSSVLSHSSAFATTTLRTIPDRYSAFDSGLDPEELQAARKWRKTFAQDALPKGNTTFSRSSGPGGQHVNKTETKATTTWMVGELMGTMPKILRDRLRSSRYYTKATDSLTIQAQAQRSRSANAEANREKLFEELVALYEATVPGETRPDKVVKYKEV